MLVGGLSMHPFAQFPNDTAETVAQKLNKTATFDILASFANMSTLSIHQFYRDGRQLVHKYQDYVVTTTDPERPPGRSWTQGERFMTKPTSNSPKTAPTTTPKTPTGSTKPAQAATAAADS